MWVVTNLQTLMHGRYLIESALVCDRPGPYCMAHLIKSRVRPTCRTKLEVCRWADGCVSISVGILDRSANDGGAPAKAVVHTMDFRLRGNDKGRWALLPTLRLLGVALA
jgi:hypothetical protein